MEYRGGSLSSRLRGCHVLSSNNSSTWCACKSGAGMVNPQNIAFPGGNINAAAAAAAAASRT